RAGWRRPMASRADKAFAAAMEVRRLEAAFHTAMGASGRELGAALVVARDRAAQLLFVLGPYERARGVARIDLAASGAVVRGGGTGPRGGPRRRPHRRGRRCWSSTSSA